MLATITWANKLTFTGTDANNFDKAFDIPIITNGVVTGVDKSHENEAINVVQTAIDDWARVINSFNYGNQSTTYQIKISMAATASTGNSISAFTPPGSIGYTNGKPSSASITIGWLQPSASIPTFTDAMTGWYLDPTPNDLEDFANTSLATNDHTDAFFGEITGGSEDGGYAFLDLFSTVEHELGHAMGLYDSPALKAVSTDTGVADAQNTATTPATDYWRIDTTHVHALWTASDSSMNDNGPAHFADAGASVTQAGQTYVGANGLMNSRDRYNGRKIIDDTLALILEDVYGYTVTLPSTFGTFYDRLDASGVLHIATPLGGNDQVSLSVVGSNLQVSMTIGHPVPGIDPSTITSTFALSSISSIDINTGDGVDTVTLSGIGASIPITLHEGGQSGDTLQIVGTAGIDHVNMGISSLTSTNLNLSLYDGVGSVSFLGGFDGSDSFVFDDRANSGGRDWVLRYDRIGLNGETFNVITSPFGSVSCLAGDGADQFYLIGNRNPLQSVNVDSGGGDDVITVGYVNPYIALYAPLTISAGAGNDTIVWNQVVNSHSGTTYPISLDGGSGYNAMSIDETSQNTSGEVEYYDIYDNRIMMSDSTSGTNADFTYDNMQAAQLQCSPNGGIVRVHSTSSDLDPGNQFSILGTPGMNTFIVYPHDAAGNLTINGNLAIGGSTSTSDNLTIDDTGSSVPTAYTFANTFGAGTTNIYGLGSAGFGAGANIENITVKGGNGGNTFNVSSFESGSTLKVYGGGGNDTLNFGASNLASNITSIAAFLFDGQGGSDTFNINNSGSSTALTYTQASGLVTVTGGSPAYSLSDASVEKLVINAGSGGDSFIVNVVPSGSQTILNGNAGLDGLGLGYASSNLNAIQGVVTFNTGADAGNLAAVDTADTTADLVHLTTTSLGAAPQDTLFGPGGALYFDNLVNFNTFPGITLNLGTGADTVFAQPLPLARVTINGNNPTTTPGDSLHVDLSTATNPVLTSNGTGAGTYTFGNAAALNYTGFESAVSGIPGDFDGNGTVAAADYNLWRAAFGSHVTPGTSADANGNGVVDAADYVIWRENLGRHTPGAGSGAAATAPVPLLPAATDVVLSPAAAIEVGNRKSSNLNAMVTDGAMETETSAARPLLSATNFSPTLKAELPTIMSLKARNGFADLLLNELQIDVSRTAETFQYVDTQTDSASSVDAADAVFAAIADYAATKQHLSCSLWT